MAECVIQVRRRGKEGYTILPNAILRDKRLSLKTKGLFLIILSLPKEWDYSVAGLAIVAGCGRNAVQSALKEMEEAGYLTRSQAQGEGGKFTGVVYTIRDQSLIEEEEEEEADAGADGEEKKEPLSDQPLSENPTADDPAMENPTQYKKDRYKKEKRTPYGPPQMGDGQTGGTRDRTVRALRTEDTGADGTHGRSGSGPRAWATEKIKTPEPIGSRVCRGSGRRIRTLTYRVRVCCATLTQSRYVVCCTRKRRCYYSRTTRNVKRKFGKNKKSLWAGQRPAHGRGSMAVGAAGGLILRLLLTLVLGVLAVLGSGILISGLLLVVKLVLHQAHLAFTASSMPPFSAAIQKLSDFGDTNRNHLMV